VLALLFVGFFHPGMTGWVVTDRDGRDDEKRSLRLRGGQLSTLQQRFEESRLGEAVISAAVILMMVVGVAWNLPDSPIKRTLTPIVGPVGSAVHINQIWALFAPAVSKRTETVEVHVTMADGAVRVWSAQLNDRAIGGFASTHWMRLLNLAIKKPEIRPDIARWVAREVTGPSDRAVAVAMVLRTQNLPAPGEEGGEATATKILYQEDLAGQQ